jgi:FAD binding domain
MSSRRRRQVLPVGISSSRIGNRINLRTTNDLSTATASAAASTDCRRSPASFFIKSTPSFISSLAARGFASASAAASATGEISRDVLPFDVLIVGGGPAGLAASIRIKQLGQQHNKELSVCVVDKGRCVYKMRG